MGATYYGARLWGSEDGQSNLRYDVIGNNAEAFVQNDIVSVSGGDLIVGTAPVVGVVVKDQTMAATNETVAKVYPGYIPVTEDNLWLMSTNSDLTGNANDHGAYYSIAGATGAQLIDVTKGAITSGPQRCVQIVKVDPLSEGGSGSGSGLRKAVVRFVNTFTNPYIASST